LETPPYYFVLLSSGVPILTANNDQKSDLSLFLS
jgi:hypothetical protein